MQATPPPLSDRMDEWLRALRPGGEPCWDWVERRWLDALLEFDGGTEAHVVDALGGAVRKRDAEALRRELRRAIAFLRTRQVDELLTISWR